jgi:hypothetical protein
VQRLSDVLLPLMMVVKAMQLLFGGQWSPLQYVSNPDADED